MAETTTLGRPAKARGPPLHQIYALPAPIRTFPLPSFYPSNPISLVHLVYAWMRQVLSPPPSEPSAIYTGVWDPDSRSVHITDHAAVRALWEQGFYGKGSLSRSEPNWLKREQIRRGAVEGDVSEQRTAQRREERRQVKWERARAEQEALERTRREEALLAHTAFEGELPATLPVDVQDQMLVPHPEIVSTPGAPVTPQSWKAPVGPLELLSLPNRAETASPVGRLVPLPKSEDLGASFRQDTDSLPIKTQQSGVPSLSTSPVGPLELLALPNSLPPSLPKLKTPAPSQQLARQDADASHINGSIFGEIAIPALSELAGCKRTIAVSDGHVEQPPKRRRKSVRFSNTVESCGPPSLSVAKCNGTEGASAEKQAVIPNREHLQLSAEEAFFLSYGIGALSIVDPHSQEPIPREELLGLFRSHSYFPPRRELGPDDPFLVHYAVYHLFRSLGWVPRHGVKFGVDWMLYKRGPVFDHAEFGLIVLPAYSDGWWRENGIEAPRRSWHWLHGMNRVLSHVLKSLVLVYVDVPPPHVFDAAMAAGGLSAALGKYSVREFMVRRWSSNRNR